MMQREEEELRRWEDYLRNWQTNLQEREDKALETESGLHSWTESLEDQQKEIDRIERNFAAKRREIETALSIKRLEVDAANVPLKEVLEEVLLLLELETDLVHIADVVRERAGIIDIKW